MAKARTGGRKSKKQSREPRASEAKAAEEKQPSAQLEKTFEKIYRMVLRIPRGRVMTYGQIARLLEDRYSPRLVGWAMHATPQDGREIPWHRVVNSRGGISTGRIILHQPDLQLLLLEAEGVEFSERGYLDLSVYQWSPARKRTKNPAASKSKEARATGNRNNKASRKTDKKKIINTTAKKTGKKS